MCQAQFYTPHVLYHSRDALPGLFHLQPALPVPLLHPALRPGGWPPGTTSPGSLLSGFQAGLSRGQSQQETEGEKTVRSGYLSRWLPHCWIALAGCFPQLLSRDSPFPDSGNCSFSCPFKSRDTNCLLTRPGVFCYPS